MRQKIRKIALTALSAIAIAAGVAASGSIPGITTHADENVPQFYYTLNDEDGTATLRYPDKNAGESTDAYKGDIVIPDEVSIDGKTYLVTAIGDEAFSEHKVEQNVTSVRIGENVTSIGKSAFFNQGKCTSVTFGANVTEIGDYAFQANHKLTSVEIPEGIENLKKCFYNCYGLKEVKFAGAPVTMSGTFSGCKALQSIVLPEGMEEIGSGSFESCIMLSNVKFPSTLKIIGNWAFETTAMSEIILPEGVESIGSMAFGNMNGDYNTNRTLTTVYLPSSLKTIQYNAFNNTAALKNLTIAPSEEPLTISGNSYYASKFLGVPEDIKDLAPIQNLSLGRQIVNTDNTDITSAIFSSKSTITDVTFNGSVTSTPDLSKAIGITNVTIATENIPACGGFSESTYANASIIVPEGTETAYAEADGWKNFVNLPRPSTLPEIDIDESKIDWTVGEGNSLAALMIRWNDSVGVDNLVMGVKSTADASADEIIAAAIAGNRRFQAIDNGYAYNLNGLEKITTYDHNLANDDSHVWNTTEMKGANGLRVVLLDYVLRSDIEAEGYLPAPEDYIFYIPSDDKIGLWVPENFNIRLRDGNDIKLPVYINYGAANTTPGSVSVAVYANSGDENADSSVIKSLSVSNYRLGNTLANVSLADTAKPADLYIRGRIRYTPEGGTAKYSEYCSYTPIHVLAPEVPMTSFNLSIVDYDGKPVDMNEGNAVLGMGTNYKVVVDYQPKNATYTKVNTNADIPAGLIYYNTITNALSTYKQAGDFTITAVSALDPKMTSEMKGSVALLNPVTSLAVSNVENGELRVKYSNMLDVNPIFTPANPDIKDIEIVISDPEMARIYAAKMDGDNFYELSTYKVGECNVTYRTTDGSGVETSFKLIVEDREREADIDYTKGIFWLNEEWFGHCNGSINFIDDDYNITYKAYERENPWNAFGATSQFATIHGDRLIVISKQHNDAGDPRQGGGRLVIADAKSLKRLASFDNIGGDGRCAVGVGSDKIYISHTAGIRVCRINGDTYTLDDNDIDGIKPTSTYNGQIGDMICAGDYVFAVQQSTGMHIIDIKTDKLVKTVPLTTVQTLTQSADGNVWLACGSKLYCFNPTTLEQIQEVDINQNISVSWGAWRSGSFKAAKNENVLFWGSSNIYRWEIGTPVPTQPIFSLPKGEGYNGANQSQYGAIGYDDETNQILVAASHGPSAMFRYNWYFFIDAATGKLNKKIDLQPYYWFPAMPVNADRHEVEFDENFKSIDLKADDMEETIDLASIISDRDDIDFNIRLSISENANNEDNGNVAEPEVPVVLYVNNADQKALSEIIDYKLEGKTLTVTPKAVGHAVMNINAESRGKVVTLPIDVNIGSTDVDNIPTAALDVKVAGHTLCTRNCDGLIISIHDINGALAAKYVVNGNSFNAQLDLPEGIYVLTLSDNKNMIKTQKAVIR